MVTAVSYDGGEGVDGHLASQGVGNRGRVVGRLVDSEVAELAVSQRDMAGLPEQRALGLYITLFT